MEEFWGFVNGTILYEEMSETARELLQSSAINGKQGRIEWVDAIIHSIARK